MISCAPRTFVSAEVMAALTTTDTMDEPTAEIDLAMMDAAAMIDAAATDTAATDAVATDAATVVIDSAAMDAAAMDAAATDTSMVLMEDSVAINSTAAMDAEDVVVGVL